MPSSTSGIGEPVVFQRWVKADNASGIINKN
jgi:hypothetical protein